MRIVRVFGESRKQSKENIICPLCRHDWGDSALTEIKKELEKVNRAPNVHKGASCKKCQAKPIRNERYRCLQCKNVDLCDRCFSKSLDNLLSTLSRPVLILKLGFRIQCTSKALVCYEK
jgi:hypothetical protein